MFIRTLIAGTLLLSCSAWGGELASPYVDVIAQPNHAHVGSIPDGCAHVLDDKGKPAKTPQGFKLSPEDALQLALKERGVQCASEPNSVRYMSANTEKRFYSIVSYWTENDRPQMLVVHIDGRSGKVTADPNN